MKILLVEDDQTIALGLEYSLKQEGYQVELSYDYEEARQTIEEKAGEFSLFLLDLSLPDGSGYDLCKLVKEKGDYPVIFLTALEDEVNVVMGLELGADDYMTKPFRIRELLARIKSVMRRYDLSSRPKNLSIEDITVQTEKGKVYKGGEETHLTALEYQLFLTLLNHQGQVLTREQLLETIWDIAGDFVTDNTLTVYIKRLREKLEDDPRKPRIIQTVRGLGYRLGD